MAVSVEVHVEGQVQPGRMPAFSEGVQAYCDYAKTHDYSVPRVLVGLSGEMNTVRLVYQFDTTADYEAQELRTLRDEEYGEVAGRMFFADGTLHYSIYREV